MYYVVKENQQPTENDPFFFDVDMAVKFADRQHRETQNHYEVISTELYYRTYDPMKSLAARFARANRARKESENVGS